MSQLLLLSCIQFCVYSIICLVLSQNHDPFADTRRKRIADRMDDYHKRQQRHMLISPMRSDPFAEGNVISVPDSSSLFHCKLIQYHIICTASWFVYFNSPPYLVAVLWLYQDRILYVLHCLNINIYRVGEKVNLLLFAFRIWNCSTFSVVDLWRIKIWVFTFTVCVLHIRNFQPDTCLNNWRTVFFSVWFVPF